MAIQKNANLDISVAAEQNPNYNVKPSVQFSTQDRNTAKYTFTVKQNNKAVDLTDVTATVTLYMADKSVFQNNATVTNAKEGKIEYTIPSDAIRHHGSAKGELKLTYANGDALGGLRFSFNIEQSLIDKVDGSQKEVYIDDFQAISNTVKKKAEEVTINLERLDEEYQNKAYTVDEKLADVQATVNDLRENGTGIDAQARQDVQQVTSQMTDIVFMVNPSMTIDTINSVLASKKHIRFQPGVYNVPINKRVLPKSNQTIEFDNGAELKIETTSQNHYEILKIVDCENLTINGGAVTGDRKTHTGTTGEHGHGVWIENTKNLVIRKMKVRDCWGDGIYHKSGENTHFDKIELDNNRRNNLTIISVKKMTIDDPVIKNSNGIAPEAGIDCEPNEDNETLTGIVVNNPYFENNKGNDFGVYLLNRVSEDTVSIEVNNANSVNTNLKHAAMFNINYVHPAIKGKISFNDCFSDNSRFLSQSDTSSTLAVSVKNPIIKDWANGNIGAITIKNNNNNADMRLGNITIDNPKFIINKYTQATVGIEIIDERNIDVKTDPINIKSPIVIGAYADKIKVLYSSFGTKFNSVNIEESLQPREFLDYTFAQKYTVNFGAQQKLKLPQDITFSNNNRIELLAEVVTMNTGGNSGEIALFVYSGGAWTMNEITPLGKTASAIPHQLILDSDGFPAIRNKHANTNYTFLIKHTLSGLYGVGKYSEFYSVNSSLLAQKAKAIANSWVGDTGYRPANPTVGRQHYDTTIRKPIWWNGTAWTDASGTVV